MNKAFALLAVSFQFVVSDSVAAEPANRISLEIQSSQPPIIEVEIGGSPVRVRLDLGDRTPLVLQQKVLDAVPAVPTGETTRMQGIDGFFEVPLFKVGRVRVGTAEFTDVVARLDTDRKGYKPDEVTKGFLGSSLLKPYQVIINYPAAAMYLQQPGTNGSRNLCTGTVVPFAGGHEAWSGEAFTEAETDVGRVLLSCDTGAFTSVIRQSLVQTAHPGDTEQTLTTKKFVLGGSDFGPKRFEVWDLSLPQFDGFVGNDFFAIHVVCVDFPKKQLHVSQARPVVRPSGP